MNPDMIAGSKNVIDYVRPHVERNLPTYEGIVRAPREDVVAEYARERMEAALSILERIIGQDMHDELAREIDRKRDRRAKRRQNLMMAERALEAIRAQNNYLSECTFYTDPLRTVKTPYGLIMEGVKEVLDRFWMGE